MPVIKAVNLPKIPAFEEWVWTISGFSFFNINKKLILRGARKYFL